MPSISACRPKVLISEVVYILLITTLRLSRKSLFRTSEFYTSWMIYFSGSSILPNTYFDLMKQSIGLNICLQQFFLGQSCSTLFPSTGHQISRFQQHQLVQEQRLQEQRYCSCADLRQHHQHWGQPSLSISHPQSRDNIL